MISNIIAGLILILAFFGAIAYIVKAKKRGVKCIGCPAAGQCPTAQSSAKIHTGNDSCCGCGISRDEMK